MLNLNGVIIFSENPGALVDFYTKVFGSAPMWSGGEFHGWQVGTGYFTVGPHDKVKGKNSNPERIMMMLESTDVEGEFERIQALGATVIAKPYHPGEEPEMRLATLADPDGNMFQIATPYKMK